MKWLKHDTDAHRDAKLRRVRMKYGMEGYGLYWYLLELIAGNISETNLSFELEEDSELISLDTGIHHERVEEVIMYMVRLELFEESNGVIACLKLLKRLDTSMTSSPAFRQTIAKAKENHDIPMIGSGQGHDGVMTESCKKRRDKKRIDKSKTGRFSPPSFEDVQAHWKAKGWVHDPRVFFDYYHEADWHDSKGRKLTHWKRNAATWNNNQKNYGTAQPLKLVEGIDYE